MEIAEADFTGENGLNGKVLVQWFGSSSATDAVIYTDLYHVHSQSRSTHHWRIYSTDILESDAGKLLRNNFSVFFLELKRNFKYCLNIS